MPANAHQEEESEATSPNVEDTLPLSEAHRKMLLEESAISREVVAERGYYTTETKKDLKVKGFGEAQRDTLAPKEDKYGLLAPVCWPHAPTPFHVYRPNTPRIKRGKPVKYEMPSGCQMAIDSPPRCHPDLGNPSVPLWLTEGQKKGDALASRGACVVDFIGVWNWRGANEHGGKTTLAEFEDVAFNGRPCYLVFDSDILQKRPVYDALVRLREVAKKRGADVWIVHLPPGPAGEKVGVDDFLAADASRSLQDLINLATKELIEPATAGRPGSSGERNLLAKALPEDAPVPADLTVPLGYEVAGGGVAKVDIVGSGENMRERKTDVSPRPIYIAGTIEPADGESHKLVLVSRYRDKWLHTLASREQVMDARRLVALASEGLPVSSGRAGLISEYLDAFEAENLEYLPAARVAAQMGWRRGGEYMHGKLTMRRG